MTFQSYSEACAGISATLAAHVHALDDGRTDDIVATFTPDGVCDIEGMGRFEGAEALREADAGWKPRMAQRHLIVNTHVSDLDDDRARAMSDVVFMVLTDAGWVIQLVGRYDDELRHADGRWLLAERIARFESA